MNKTDLETVFFQSFPNTCENRELIKTLDFGITNYKEYQFIFYNNVKKSLNSIFLSGRDSIKKKSICKYYPNVTEHEFMAAQMVMTAVWIGCYARELDEPWFNTFWEHNNRFTKFLQKLASQVVQTGSFSYNRQMFEESYFYETSHASHNISLIKKIEYGQVRDRYTGKWIYGLKIKDKNILISELAESFECKKFVKKFHEEIHLYETESYTFKEVKAALRLNTLLMKSLEVKEC